MPANSDYPFLFFNFEVVLEQDTATRLFVVAEQHQFDVRVFAHRAAVLGLAPGSRKGHNLCRLLIRHVDV